VSEGDDFYTCFGSDLVKMLESSGCDTIITLNSLMTSPKGFAQSSCFINIEAPELVVPILIKKRDFEDPVIIGSKPSPNNFRTIDKLKSTFKLFGLQSGLGFFNQNNYTGEDVNGRDVLLYSSLIRSGNTMRKQVRELKNLGAKSIYFFGFHGLCMHH
jgi:phosphoribosylpyrophosphate synthetase